MRESEKKMNEKERTTLKEVQRRLNDEIERLKNEKQTK